MAYWDGPRKPCSDLSAESWARLHLLKQRFARDPIEAFCNISIIARLCYFVDRETNCIDRIMARAAGAKSIAVGFKPRFPFRFERLLDQSLFRAIAYSRNSQAAFLVGAGFWYLDPTDRTGFPIYLQSRTQLEPLLWSQ